MKIMRDKGFTSARNIISGREICLVGLTKYSVVRGSRKERWRKCITNQTCVNGGATMPYGGELIICCQFIEINAVEIIVLNLTTLIFKSVLLDSKPQ